MSSNFRIIFTLAFSLLILGCEAFNDNPTSGNSLRIRVADLQTQLGITHTTSSDPTATPTKTIVLGPLVVRSRPGLYTTTEPITQALRDELSADLQNSIDFMVMIRIPSADPYVEITLPPPGAEDWQVVGMALSSEPPTLADLGTATYADSVAYIAFSPQKYSYDQVDQNPINLRFRRACLADVPPKGCASYRLNMDSTVLTPSVEIQDVLYNVTQWNPDGSPVDGTSAPLVPNAVTLPLIVHLSGDIFGGSVGLSNLKNNVVSAIGAGAITNLTVVTTHSQNPNETANCQAGIYANCTKQYYSVDF